MVPSDSRRKSDFIPGEAGVWVFVIGDMIIFSLFFVVYLYYRGYDPELFAASQAKLKVFYGAINMVFLLTSSWFVATAVERARENKVMQARWCFAGGFLMGACFFTVKIIEYSEKISAGYTLISNDFFMYYFILTGIHFVHVIIGMIILLFLMLRLRRGSVPVEDHGLYEGGGVYWHMVDLLWIVLFPLIYLVH